MILEQYRLFESETDNPVAASILTLVAWLDRYLRPSAEWSDFLVDALARAKG